MTSGAYNSCAAWLCDVAAAKGLNVTSTSYKPNKPVVVCTLEGSEPSLPSILLNCHYDVVPVNLSEWRTDPFNSVEVDGKIYGRGSQDMKSVCMQYLEAVGNLKAAGVALRRTVHISFVPDEEIGGLDGMGEMIKAGVVKDMNVCLALDEGLASESNKCTVFYGERALWWLKVRSTGPTGHASRFVKDSAMEKLIKSINKFLEFRREQEVLLDDHGCKHSVAKKLGDVVTLNLTMLNGGVTADGGKTYALNVVPMEAVAGFDMRIPPHVPLDEMEAKVKEWTTSFEGVTYEFLAKVSEHAVTSIDETKNAWWKVFQDGVALAGIDIEPAVFPAATDGRYLRQIGIPCFGFSPMNNTPVLLHDHNEFVGRETYLRGITIYETLITHLANAEV